MPHRSWSLALVSVHVVSCGTGSGDAGVWKHHVDLRHSYNMLKTSENSICLETKSCTATANEQKWIKMTLPQDAQQVMRSIRPLSFTKLVSTWGQSCLEGLQDKARCAETSSGTQEHRWGTLPWVPQGIRSYDVPFQQRYALGQGSCSTFAYGNRTAIQSKTSPEQGPASLRLLGRAVVL